MPTDDPALPAVTPGPPTGNAVLFTSTDRGASMPSTWTDKQERKYEHIRDSEREQGAAPKRAEEIAARTVNKERAQKGQSQTASRSSTDDMSSSRRGGLRSGTDRPRGRTKEQLYNEAKQRGIEGRSSMSKAQLQRAVDANRR
jgi:plasmid stabilization system protein ParE